MIRRMFTEHPETVGETYGEHFFQANRFAFRMFTASIACFIHGLIPCLFVKTGSNAIQQLNEWMVEHRDRQTPERRARKLTARNHATQEEAA